MHKNILRKLVLLSLVSLAMGPQVTKANAILTSGTPYTGTSVDNASNSPLIDSSGNYSIVNSNGNTLAVNGSGYRSTELFDLSNGAAATLNGNIVWNASNNAGGAYDYEISEVNGGNLTVNGNTKITIDNTNSSAGINELFRFGDKAANAATTGAVFNGNLDITANGSAGSSQTLLSVWGTNTTVNINGNLNLSNTVSGSSGMANALYAGNDSATAAGPTINVNGDTTHIQAISANDPKAITAGDMSTININSKTTQVIGNISFLGHASNSSTTLYPGGTVKATFDGANSYWYGDEENYTDLCSLFGGNPGTLDLTLKNGAEWIYFGDTHTKTISFFGKNITIDLSQPKYISAITLEDGGIINLQDADIQQKLAAISGLTDIYTKLKSINHDYVTIGDLKGSNGIFKLDMNVNDKSKSDMIFVNSSSNPGKHYIQSNLTEADLRKLSSANTLRFATTAAAANGVSFGVNKTYSGNLWNYNTLVGSSAYNANDSENTLYNTRCLSTDGSINGTSSLSEIDDTYAGGTNWFLYGIEKTTPSNFAYGLVKIAGGAYDFAMDMDTLNKRNGEKQYIDEQNGNSGQGLWLRIKHTDHDLDNVTSNVSNMYQIGYDKLINNGQQRIGGAIDYKSGSSDVTHIPGTMDNSRRGITLYDTFNLGKSNDYLDLVFRYGRLHNDFSVLGSDNSWVNGNYNDNVETLSAEYGVKKVWNNNNFIEPQLQFQFGHLGSSAYTTSNSTRVYLDGANSIIARAGFRLGHEYKNGIGYFKADLIHEFDGGQDVTLSDQNDSYSSQINKRGTWYDVGFGGTYALNDKCSAYADIERVFGSEVKDWELNVGTKWSF